MISRSRTVGTRRAQGARIDDSHEDFVMSASFLLHRQPKVFPMLKQVIVSALIASSSVYVAGCGAKDPNSAQDAKSDLSPTDQVRATVEDLSKQVDAIAQPVTDVDDVVTTLQQLPKKYGIKPADLKVMAKGAFDGGDITLSASIDPAAKDDVMALLTKVKGIGTGLKTTPDKVTALLAQLPPTMAKVPVLLGKASASLTAKASNPFGSADDKAKAKAELAGLDQLKTDTMKKFDDIKAKVTGLPSQASQAMAKITAALS